MRVLFIGDVVGRKGRRLVAEMLPFLKSERSADIVIANGENLAAGLGTTAKTANQLFESGVDLITGGNHIFAKKEAYQIIDQKLILRPANYPPSVPGRGSILMDVKGEKVGVINLCGRVFMEALDCPFRRADEEIEMLKAKTKIIVVDMHAEATSEKVAMGWYLDGKVSAVIGTHTHIQTADAQILPKGTAYITDVGMVGGRDSVIGVKKELVLRRFLTQLPIRFKPSEEVGIFCGAVIEIDAETGLSTSIEPICIKE
jgi:hypothetical protein